MFGLRSADYEFFIVTVFSHLHSLTIYSLLWFMHLFSCLDLDIFVCWFHFYFASFFSSNFLSCFSFVVFPCPFSLFFFSSFYHSFCLLTLLNVFSFFIYIFQNIFSNVFKLLFFLAFIFYSFIAYSKCNSVFYYLMSKIHLPLCLNSLLSFIPEISVLSFLLTFTFFLLCCRIYFYSFVLDLCPLNCFNYIFLLSLFPYSFFIVLSQIFSIFCVLLTLFSFFTLSL